MRPLAICAGLLALVAAPVAAFAPPGRHVQAAKHRRHHVTRRARHAPRPARGANPLAALALYVAPDSRAASSAAGWPASDPRGAAALRYIAVQPQAQWLDANSSRADITGYVEGARGAHALPVLVAYNLPNRDCGQYSAGGAGSADQYRAFITMVTDAVGPAPAAVILEPDALAELDCLDAAGQASYYQLLRDAVATLAAHANIAVYVDAGNASWHPADTIAKRLTQAGVAQARGFALNVSNFDTTAGEVAYGTQISALLGGTPFVVDTSRNGAGPAPDGQWCNPAGRALGRAPTAQTGNRLIDAYLWVKAPGESDGQCNGGPGAGGWWPQYAIDLAERAGVA